MKEAGFEVHLNEVSAGNPELVWMVCRRSGETAGDGSNT